MDKELKNKILELFEYRELPTLIQYGGQEFDKEFYDRLIQLQYDIYRLDEVLESSWDVDCSKLSEKWAQIYRSLCELGISKANHDTYCKHIYKYQKHELEVRQMRLPTRLSMEYFYFYKSCDVKLLRRLIYNSNASLRKDMKLAHWRLFDLVTEINDDVEDVFEDVSTINCNRFLISMIQFGPAKAKDIFDSFLDEIELRNKQMDYHLADMNVFEWTQEQIHTTRKLINERLTEFSDLNLSKYDFVKESTSLRASY